MSVTENNIVTQIADTSLCQVCVGRLAPFESYIVKAPLTQKLFYVTYGEGDVYYNTLLDSTYQKGDVVPVEHTDRNQTTKVKENGAGWVVFNKIDGKDFDVEVFKADTSDFTFTTSDTKQQVLVSLYAKLVANNKALSLGKFAKLGLNQTITIRDDPNAVWAIVTAK